MVEAGGGGFLHKLMWFVGNYYDDLGNIFCSAWLMGFFFYFGSCDATLRALLACLLLFFGGRLTL